VRTTERPGHAGRIAREALEAGGRDFLAVGGDGTCFEVLNGLFPLPAGTPRPRVATLPLGTGNSFLRDYGVLDVEGAARALREDRRRAVDVIRCVHDEGELHYLNLIGVGFAARAGAMTNRRFKAFGSKGYVLAVLGCLVRMRYPVFRVRLDGGATDERPCSMLSFCNSRFTGGNMMMAPEADASDGKLDVVRIGPLRRFRFLRTFPRIFEGTHVRIPEIECTRAGRVEFHGDERIDVMVDGEIRSLVLRSLEVLPGALEAAV
jgi:diacylglycerol kinase (ATP)